MADLRHCSCFHKSILSNYFKMKHIYYLRSASAMFFLAGSLSLHAQESVNVTGGNATGTGGSASYSVGQVAYTVISGTGGSAEQGVQHVYNVSVVSSAEVPGISLAAKHFRTRLLAGSSSAPRYRIKHNSPSSVSTSPI